MSTRSPFTDRDALYPGQLVTVSEFPATVVFPLSMYHIVHAGRAVADVFAAIDGAEVPAAAVEPVGDVDLAAAFPTFVAPPRPGGPTPEPEPPPSPPSADALREAEVAAVVNVLLGEVGFALLAASTVPAIKDRASPLARAAAESWARQTFADEPDDEPEQPETSDGDDQPPQRRPTWRRLVAVLVRSGHQLRDVLHVRHLGLLGTLAPFPGYTLRQAQAFAIEAARLRNADRVAAATDAAMAIAGTSGTSAGGDVFDDHLAALRSA
jgi:hypothetical protein